MSLHTLLGAASIILGSLDPEMVKVLRATNTPELDQTLDDLGILPPNTKPEVYYGHADISDIASKDTSQRNEDLGTSAN